MKKRLALLVCLVLTLVLLTGCARGTMHLLDSLFTANSLSTAPAQGGASAEEASVTVTLTREEYENYQRFSDLYELYDIASAYFYIEPDYDKMVEYAARGLLAGLGDPYTYYYNPEEFQEMMEDDEGNYVGIGVLISANYKTQLCTISRVFDGSPAEEADVQRGIFCTGSAKICT